MVLTMIDAAIIPHDVFENQITNTEGAGKSINITPEY